MCKYHFVPTPKRVRSQFSRRYTKYKKMKRTSHYLFMKFSIFAAHLSGRSIFFVKVRLWPYLKCGRSLREKVGKRFQIGFKIGRAALLWSSKYFNG